MRDLLYHGGRVLIEAGYNVSLQTFQTKKFAERNPRALTVSELREAFKHGIYNVCILLGAQLDGTKVMAVDIDSETAKNWAKTNGILDVANMITFSSRGVRVLMRTMLVAKNRIKVNGGVDILYNGGLTMPPSVHPTGFIYHYGDGGILEPAALPVFDHTLLPPEPTYEPIKIEFNGDRWWLIERARRYLREAGGAVSGDGGHNKTFRLCCRVLGTIGLTVEEAWPVFLEWNGGCEPPWAERELYRKLAEAEKRVYGGGGRSLT